MLCKGGAMYFFVFLLIVKICLCDIEVLIDDLKGSYSILINNRIWLRSSYTSLYNSNQWYTTKDGSLCFISKDFKEGNHSILGEWNETQLIYNFNLNEKLNNLTGRIRQWKSISAITFYFDSGTIDLNNDILLDMDRVRTVFPSFYIEQIDKDDHRSYLTFGGIHSFIDDFVELFILLRNDDRRFGKTCGNLGFTKSIYKKWYEWWTFDFI